MLKFNKPTCALLIAVAALVVSMTSAAVASEGAPETSESAREPDEVASDSTAEAQPALQSGRVVYVNPKTGRKELPSAAQRAADRAHLGSMINRSTDGLIETASPTSGVMVNLQGRFRHATSMKVTPNGESSSMCSAALPPAHDEEANHE